MKGRYALFAGFAVLAGIGCSGDPLRAHVGEDCSVQFRNGTATTSGKLESVSDDSLALTVEDSQTVRRTVIVERDAVAEVGCTLVKNSTGGK